MGNDVISKNPYPKKRCNLNMLDGTATFPPTSSLISEGATHVANSQNIRRAAFTLAEVLITLGIIGVVAALTMPNIIHKYRNKVLETQFKKSVSVISQAVLRTKSDTGIDNYAQYCVTYPGDYVNASECADALYKNIMMLGSRQETFNPAFKMSVDREYDKIMTYNSKQQVTPSSLLGIGNALFYTNALPDGSYFNQWIIEGFYYIVVDTNGGKAPNKLGHDIFILAIDSKKDVVTYAAKPKEDADSALTEDRLGSPCNLSSNLKGNGIGCAYYALQDVCPYDENKRYFECLP